MKYAILIALLILLTTSGCAKQEDTTMKLTSPAFQDNGKIPDKYTCKGEDINPELKIEGLPEKTKTLALIMDDPDAPRGTWDHWILFNVQPTAKIAENSVPPGAVQGKNSWGKNEYGGPCPPSGTHRYVFKLYALDSPLDLDEKATKQDVENAMEGHIIAQAKLTGLYSK